MNFLKITDKDDNDHYINFDLVYEFKCEEFKEGIPSHLIYCIHFDIAYENWSLAFKDKKDRDNKLEMICNHIARVR